MLSIFAIDAFTPLDVAIAVMYVVVVLLSTRAYTRRGVQLVGALCLALTVLAYLLSHSVIHFDHASGRLLVSLAAIGITSFLAIKSKDATDALLARTESLRRSEAFLAGAQRISQTGSFSFCLPDGPVYWSDEAARIFGYPAGVEPSVERVLRHTFPDDRAQVRMALARTGYADQPVELRHRVLLPDGALRHVHVLAHPQQDASGRREFLGALRDITQEVEAEQALHRSQEQLAHVTRVTMLGELTASISHEVNQPLAAIAANGEACLRWLDRPRPDLGEARMAVASLLQACTRASEVIKRIRALARKSEPLHLALDLNTVIEEAVALVRRELDGRQVALVLQLTPALPPVSGDRVQLQQVLINLLINAIQAMQDCPPGQAVLTLASGRDADGGMQCSVTDSGRGIAPEHLPQLFEAFFSTKSDGMGMGLPICRSIIEAHGGRLWAHSRHGAGATFFLTLPAMSEPSHAS